MKRRRLLAARGAHLVHSAPSTGVRDWSDLRIAVAAGIWLAAARPGDVIEVVSDDRAFDAVGDVAASLGIEFRRLSYRRIKEGSRTRPWRRKPGRRPRAPRARAAGAVAVVAVPADRPHRPVTVGTSIPARRRGTQPQGGHRGGRAGGVRGRPAPSHHAARPHPEPAQTTAPHDELVSVVRGLVEASPRRAVSIDSVANALKSRGFQRSPGSPRLVTRLRRIREIVVSQSGTITLADDAPPIESQPRLEVAPPVESKPTRMEEEPTAASAPIDEFDDEDSQPDFLTPPRPRDGAARGGRQPRGAAVHAAKPQPGRSSGRRRRRRRWRGGPRQPAAGQPQS